MSGEITGPRLADESFVRELCYAYLEHFSIRAAAEKVGIPESTAYKYFGNEIVIKMLRKVSMKSVINAGLSASRVLEELANSAFLDVVHWVDEKGFVRCNIHDIPEHARRCIVEIEQTVQHQSVKDVKFDKNGMTQVVETKIIKTKVKGMSKEKTLELIGKYNELAMFKDVVETTRPDDAPSVKTRSLQERVEGLEKDREASLHKPE